MPFDGSGNFNRTQNFSADASAGIQAQAALFDDELDGMATGLENCQTLTGETTPTANSPMGGFKHTGVAAATSTDNYLRADQSSNQVGIYVRDTNTGVSGTISASAAVFPTAFTDGQRVTVKVSADGSAVAPRAIVINGLSANIVDNEGSAMQAANMKKDGIFDLVYDSSANAFRAITPSNESFANIFSAEASSQSVAFTSSGKFTVTYEGFVGADRTASCAFNIAGSIVCLNFGGTVNATSDAVTFRTATSAIPTAIVPDTQRTVNVAVKDNGTNQMGKLLITFDGQFSFLADLDNSTFTASGLKGFIGNQNITYYLDDPA